MQRLRLPRGGRSQYLAILVVQAWFPPGLVSLNRLHPAEQRDERAPLHSITSSAMSSRSRGTSRFSDLAVLRLMISSYLVGCSTGRSAGFAPFKILPT